MNAKRINYYVTGVAVFLAMFSSCGKENQQIDYNVGVLASQEYVQSQQMMNLLLNTYFKSITDSLLIADHSSEIDGATVSYYAVPEETIIINYPVWGCNDECGHNRAGKITAVANPGFYDSLAVISFSFQNFRYDKDTLLVNRLTLTNLGKQDGSHDSYSVTSGLIQLLYADTTGLTQFSMNHMYVRVKDPSTIYHSPEDQFRIWGEMKGVTSKNYSYKALVEGGEAYILDKLSCPWAKLGPALLTLESQIYSTFILFPGADTCANRYVVDIEGNSFYFPFD